MKNQKIKKLSMLALAITVGLCFCGCGGRSYGTHSNYNNSDYEADYDLDDDEEVAAGARTVEEMLLADLDASMTPEEYLTPSKALTNAILEKLYITINSETSDSCTLTFRYPDVATLFTEQTQIIGDNPTEEQINGLLEQLTQAVLNDQCETVEVTCDLNILTNDDGSTSLEWTEEAVTALTGGLYGLLQ